MEKGFFKELFDISMSSFITVRLIKFLYVIAIIFSCIVGLFILLGGFGMLNFSPASGFLMVLISPVVTFVGIVYSRVLLELIIVLFRIEEHTRSLVEEKRSKESGG